jgi:hypothetical protein
MDVVRPITLDASTVTSTTVTASTEAEWVVGTAYVTGNVVKVTSKKAGSTSDVIHHEYEALSNSTGVYPPDDIDAAVPKWLDLGAENSWKMFDGGVATQTVDVTQIGVVLSPGGITSLALLNVVGASARVVVQDGAETVYDQTISLALDNVGDWWEYFYEPIVRKTDIIFTGIPSYSAGVVTVTISNASGQPVGCGLLVCGLSKNLGRTLYGVKPGITDYSVKTTNAFGDAAWLRRSNSRRIEADLSIDSIILDETFRLLALYTATPILWVVSDLYACTLVYGVFKDFQIVLSYLDACDCAIEIEGLV